MTGRQRHFAAQALEQFVTQFKPGAPLFREHGTVVVGHLRSIELVASEGETELWGDADIAQPPGTQSLEEFAGTGFSVAVVEHGADWRGDEALVVAVDTIAFSDAARRRLRKRLPALMRPYVIRYHQFAFSPPAAIVLDARDGMVLHGDDVDLPKLRTAIARALADLVIEAELDADSVLLRMRFPNSLELDVGIPTSPPSDVREAVRSAVDTFLTQTAEAGGEIDA